MNPALETLLLPFAPGGLPVPDSALFLGAEPHPDLKAWPMLTGWQPHRPLASAWERAGFDRTENPHGSWPLVLILPGKSKEETLGLFARAHDLLQPGGLLVACMPNTAGASRFEKELSAVAGQKVVSQSKHKCRVFHIAKSPDWNAAALASWREMAAPRLVPGTSFQVQAGIFSPDHIDPASALLVEHFPPRLKGVAADLGAGWGFLSQALATHAPELKSIHLFEADSRALDCARHNLCESPVETFFHWHDVTTGLPARYDVIVTNPPFHTGQNTDITLGRAFLQNAAAALRIGGRLLIVANRQLPYEAALDQIGLPWRKELETGAYKLLFAERRR